MMFSSFLAKGNQKGRKKERRTILQVRPMFTGINKVLSYRICLEGNLEVNN